MENALCSVATPAMPFDHRYMNTRDSQISPALRIALVGVGNLGSAFAFQLARVGGHHVTAIARPGSRRFEQLESAGGIVNTMQGRAEVEVAQALDEQVSYDLVIVTLLAHQVEAVLPALQRSRAKAFLFMFNNFEPEQLRDAVGAQRCCFGMPFIQARLDSDGRLSAKIGAAGQKSKIDSRRWVSLFNAAGLPAVFEANMLLWLRCHVPLGAAFESVSVAAMRRGGGAPWKRAMVIARGGQASFTLIQQLGYPLYPRRKALLRASPTWIFASMLWFMSRIPSFRELLATGLHECHALVDSLVASASRNGQASLVDAIAAMKPEEQ